MAPGFAKVRFTIYILNALAKKILFLYAEAMGYTMALLDALEELSIKTFIIYYDHKRLSNYLIPERFKHNSHPRSTLNEASLMRLCVDYEPDIVYVSGWSDNGYLAIANLFKSKGKPVVMGMDNQWKGSMKQYFFVLLSRTIFRKRYFSHAWVPGLSQYEYARRLGFPAKNIITNLYSADLKIFASAYNKRQTRKTNNYPKRFLYVGRFAQVKGLDTLLEAWQMLNAYNHGWELHLIGNGPLENDLRRFENVIIHPFMQPSQLAEEVTRFGCFILPSKKEAWGVVVHEFAAAGLPLILSDEVGSANAFMVPGFNGYQFTAGNPLSLKQNMEKIVNMKVSDLDVMGSHSHALSLRISPYTSAYNLLSCSL